MEEQLTLDARNKTTESLHELKPRITVIGIGGAGGNAVNNMIRYQLEGVDFITGNTDAQALAHSLAPHRIQLGLEITQGLGAGSRPDVGKAAAEETVADVMNHIKGSHMVFITAGMGGGTGTGAAPVIAKAAREAGILTVGVVTKPFHFEGSHRMKSAEKGITELQQYVDTLIVIPNQNLFRVANERTTFADAFKMADDVLYSGVRGVTDLMIMPGLINLDFADIRSVMGEMGKAMMGTGEAEGENRAVEAAEAAISNPLLDDVSMRGARGVLINITGGYDMTLFEVDEAANRIRQEVDPEANIIFGSTFDEKMEGIIRVSVVATGIDADASHLRAFGNKTGSNGFGTTSLTQEVTQSLGQGLESHTEVEDFDDVLTASSHEAIKQTQEQHEEVIEHVQSTETYRAPRKLSFFERLTGRRRAPDFEEDHFFEQPSSRSKAKVRADDDLNLDESEELEIPAFLRRKK
jgi:cell division protein FtsZ